MPKTLFESATLKLTAYYLMIITIICLLFCAAIYHFAEQALRSSWSHQTQRISEQYPGFDFSDALHGRGEYDEGAHRILVNLLYLNIVVLSCAGFASYVLAKHTLRPIRQSLDQQERFTADVSHELRTPLTALTMSSEVALLDPKASKQSLRDALESNLGDAKKLDELINNLLRLTRLETSELQSGFTSVDLGALTKDVINEVTPSARLRGITFEQSEMPQALVAGDAASLRQLLMILVDNAVKYSKNDETIRIAGKTDESEAVITITDTGIGIAASELPHVFERFYRADTARTRNDTSGYGLGLSIAKMIADAHDAVIHITSAPKKGTTVALHIPLQKP